MLTLTNLKVTCSDPDSLDLTWEFENTTEDLSDYRIDVYRCESPSENIAEYDKVASDLGADIYFFEDTSLSGLYHGTRTWFYTLDVKNISTGENLIQPSEPSYVNGEIPNRKFMKIIKDKKLVLKRRHAGRDLVVLKRRTWGQRSDAEWDPVLFKRNSEEAPEDETWGTGWVDGYFKPIGVRGMINNAPTMQEITPWGEFYPSDALLNILNKPPLKPKDLVIDNNNKRYRVEGVRPVEMLGHVIEQKAQLALIHPSDEIYKINIDLEAIAEAQGDDSELNLQSPGDNFNLIEN